MRLRVVEVDMVRESGVASPLAAVDDTAGTEVIEAFKCLASEHRLAILLALWEEYEPFQEKNTVPFSVLRQKVGMRDKGRFHYHLRQLTDRFVERTDAGYRLRPAGLQIVQTVIAGVGITDLELEATAVERECNLCGCETRAAYRDGKLFWVCVGCDGLFEIDEFPEGALAGWEFNPAGFTDRNPAEAQNAATSQSVMQSAVAGVCDVCMGPMDGWLDACTTHAGDGVCSHCGFRDAAVARFRCRVCKRHHQMVPRWLVLEHPAVVALYYENGVALQYEVGEANQPRRELNFQAFHDQELVSTDPPLVRVTVEYDGDGLELVIDDELSIVELVEDTH